MLGETVKAWNAPFALRKFADANILELESRTAENKATVLHQHVAHAYIRCLCINIHTYTRTQESP